MDATLIVLGLVLGAFIISEWVGSPYFDFGGTAQETLLDRCLMTGFCVNMFTAILGIKSFAILERDLWIMSYPINWIVCAIGVSIVVAGIFTLLQRRMKRSRQALWTWGLSILLLSPALMTGNAYILNAALDIGPSEMHQTQLISKDARRSKSGQLRYFYISDWERPGEEIKLRVNRETYNLHNEGDLLIAEVAKGFLGVPWMRKFHKIQKAEVKT